MVTTISPLDFLYSLTVPHVLQDKEVLDDGVGKLGRFHEATSAEPRTKAEKPAKIG